MKTLALGLLLVAACSDDNSVIAPDAQDVPDAQTSRAEAFREEPCGASWGAADDFWGVTEDSTCHRACAVYPTVGQGQREPECTSFFSTVPLGLDRCPTFGVTDWEGYRGCCVPKDGNVYFALCEDE